MSASVACASAMATPAVPVATSRMRRGLNRTVWLTSARRHFCRVASWPECAAAEPEFAARVRKLLSSRTHLTMATLRRDGSPRITGTEVEFSDDQVQIGSMPAAVKAFDLLRDPRVAIHGPNHDPTKRGVWRVEAKIAGRAVVVTTDGEGHW